MADECVFSAHDMLAAVQAGAADVVSLKLVKHGGLLATRNVAAVAEAAGSGGMAAACWRVRSVRRRTCRFSPASGRWRGAANISAHRY